MSKLTTVDSVERIIVLDRVNGPVTIYEDKGKKKKQSSLLKPFEKRQRKMAKAMINGGERYLEGHDKSNTKKKDGWLRDIGKNAQKAMRRGMKELKVRT